jgi:hypothetical protein
MRGVDDYQRRQPRIAAQRAGNLRRPTVVDQLALDRQPSAAKMPPISVRPYGLDRLQPVRRAEPALVGLMRWKS